VEQYRRKTQKLVSRFLDNEITLEECTAGLDKALADVAPWVRQGFPIAVRILTSVNNETVMREVDRRKTSQSRQLCGHQRESEATEFDERHAAQIRMSSMNWSSINKRLSVFSLRLGR